MNCKVKSAVVRGMLGMENVKDIRFAGQLALAIGIYNSDEANTFFISKDGIFYNPSFIKDMDKRDICMVVYHEIMHKLFDHIDRGNSKDPLIWNYAVDYIVNYLTSKHYHTQLNKFSRIHIDGNVIERKNDMCICFDPTIDNLIKKYSAETLYEKLIINKETYKNISDLGENKIDNDDGFGNEEIIEKVLNTLNKQPGTLTLDIDRLINSILGKDNVFIDELSQELLMIGGDEISYWGKPTILDDFVGGKLPRYKTFSENNAIFVIDTSGSMTDKDVREPLEQISDLFNNYDLDKIAIIYWDAKCKKIEIFESGEELIFKPKGGGGTDFRNLFKWLNKEGFGKCDIEEDATIFIWTDGNAFYPKTKDIDNHTVWIINNKWKVNPNLGKTINVL